MYAVSGCPADDEPNAIPARQMRQGRQLPPDFWGSRTAPPAAPVVAGYAPAT